MTEDPILPGFHPDPSAMRAGVYTVVRTMVGAYEDLDNFPGNHAGPGRPATGHGEGDVLSNVGASTTAYIMVTTWLASDPHS